MLFFRPLHRLTRALLLQKHVPGAACIVNMVRTEGAALAAGRYVLCCELPSPFAVPCMYAVILTSFPCLLVPFVRQGGVAGAVTNMQMGYREGSTVVAWQVRALHCTNQPFRPFCLCILFCSPPRLLARAAVRQGGVAGATRVV